MDRPEPSPDAGEILIDVRAAGVNFADILARMGFYRAAPAPPCVLGFEVAGTVIAVGDTSSGFAPGDRVAAVTRFGGYAERVAVGADQAVPLPPSWSFEEGAGLLVTHATAWTALVRCCRLMAGERVLVHAAGGGVGLAAVRLASNLGATVYGTASRWKHSAILAEGAHVCLDRQDRGWARGLPPFDVVIDGLGGRSFRRSFSLLGPGGRLVCIGAASIVGGTRPSLLRGAATVLQMPRFGLLRQMRDSQTVIGLDLLTLWSTRPSIHEWTAAVGELVTDGVARVHVHRAVPVDLAGDAHTELVERANLGKVVLVP